MVNAFAFFRFVGVNAFIVFSAFDSRKKELLETLSILVMDWNLINCCIPRKLEIVIFDVFIISFNE